MIEILLNQYGDIFVVISLAAVGLFIFGSACIFRQHLKITPQVNAESNASTVNLNITATDIHAIAGCDVIATQLDLARAYLETGRKRLAMKILEHVQQHGDQHQQQEAGHLKNKFNV